ncbi:hypothetical protein OXX79_013837, partial [Metschnikowia pulcherrima]
PKREEKEFDWSSARGSGVGAGVGAGAGAGSGSGSGNFRRKEREEKDFDWKRGQALPPKPKAPAAKKETKKDVKKDVDGPQKSLYDVLSLEDDGSDAESAPQQSEQPEKSSSGASAETGLESQVAQVSVSDGDWKTVGK